MAQRRSNVVTAAAVVGVTAGVAILALWWRRRAQKKAAERSSSSVNARLAWPQRTPTKNDSVSVESFNRMRQHQIRASDVFILTAPKTGTTLLTQICHQLRTGGELDFEDMYQRIPWPRVAYDIGLDCDDEQIAFPRCFKSHSLLSASSRSPKYLVTVRDPVKTFISWYRFLTAKNVPPVLKYASVSDFVFDNDFVAEDMRFGGTLWEYYVEFWEARHDPKVLLLVFEDLVKDIRGHLPAIAHHMGLALDATTPEKMDLVERLSSRETMLRHSSKFDESWTWEQARRLKRCPDPDTWAPAPRVTAGHQDALNAAALAELQRQWTTRVYPRTGHATYQDMVTELRAERHI